jgi:hypothetical protein
MNWSPDRLKLAASRRISADLLHQRLVGARRPGRSSAVRNPVQQGQRKPPRLLGDLLVDPDVRLDVELDPGEDEPFALRPLLPLLVSGSGVPYARGTPKQRKPPAFAGGFAPWFDDRGASNSR